MLDWIRARLAQRMQTVHMPVPAGTLPDRYRGRPSLSGDSTKIDVGACLFSPEEAVEVPGSRVSFTGDYRMATSSREALVTPTGEVELARSLNESMRRLFGRSLRLRSVAAGSCGGCEAELTALGNVVFDMARFGIQFVASPRHADGIVVTGAVSANMREALLATYAAVADPKIVIAVGACAISGGPFAKSPEVLGGVPADIPVDLWIPGCPPHPLTVLDGLLRMLGRLEREPGRTRPQ